MLTIALYFLGYWLIYRLEKATPLMLSVGVAILLTCYFRNIKLSTLGWGRSNIGILLFHYGITVTFILTLPSVLGEEIAWRGFLVPELEKSGKSTPSNGIKSQIGTKWINRKRALLFILIPLKRQKKCIYKIDA